jgi:hypothetical protein
MNIDKIFSLFDGEEFNFLKEKAQAIDVSLDYKNHPLFWVGMFKKLILNQHVFQKRLIDVFKTPEDEFGVEGMEEAGEYIAHHRAWNFIKDCVITDEVWMGSLSIQHDDHLDTAIKLSISFFEDAEEYEKCAFLVKIQKYLKDNLDV